jgi:hypothetical protein
MRKLSFLVGVAAATIIVAVAALIASRFPRDTTARLSKSEMATIRGASQFLYTLGIVSCSEFNAAIANNPNSPPIPGLPPGNYLGADLCSNNNKAACIDCSFTGNPNDPGDVDPSNFYVSSNSGPGSGQMLDINSVSCGSLFIGNCLVTTDPNTGAITSAICNTNQQIGACANANEAANQVIKTSGTPPPTGGS